MGKRPFERARKRDSKKTEIAQELHGNGHSVERLVYGKFFWHILCMYKDIHVCMNVHKPYLCTCVHTLHIQISHHSGFLALLTLTCRYLGSFFLRKSRLSYIRANPVLLPPPKAVRNPKQTMTSEVVLYIFAKSCLSSLLGTLALPGCKTSTT